MSGYHYRSDPGERKAGNVPLRLIHVHPSNIRKDLGDLRELTASIRRRGVMVPVILEPYGQGAFRLRDGHRRFAAADLAGLKAIPAVIHGHALCDSDWALQAVEVNEQRRGLSPAERRDNVLRLRDLGWKNADIAEAYGVSVGTVCNWVTYQGQDGNPHDGRRKNPGGHTVGKKRLRALLDEWADRLPAGYLDAMHALIEPPAEEATS